ncbi:hypothetical protein BFV93_1683 [Alteromonas macleodii]|nr:hypothetical protein BFV93_1683 [Alteromonas macleodii]
MAVVALSPDCGADNTYSPMWSQRFLLIKLSSAVCLPVK